jgi:hypothetical protein
MIRDLRASIGVKEATFADGLLLAVSSVISLITMERAAMGMAS